MIELAESINLLLVHPSLPARSVKELIALGKARPGALNFGSPGIGTPGHLATELMNTIVKDQARAWHLNSSSDQLNLFDS